MMAKKQKTSKKKEGNVYDKIFKENIEPIFIPLIKRELGIDIKSFQIVKEKYQRTIERETDFLYQVHTESNETFLLHIEFQTKLGKKMLYRIAEYHGIVSNRYQMPIKHIVIYLGKPKTRAKTYLKDNEIFTGYDLIALNLLDTNELLSSQIPEEVLVAILSNFNEEDTERILKTIVYQLKKISDGPNDLKKYLNQLILFSRLRNLEVETTKIITSMPIHYDIKKDGLYNLGLKEGREEGREEAEKRAKKVQLKLEKEAREQQQKAREQQQKAREQQQKTREQQQKAREKQQQDIQNLLNLKILTDKQIAESLDVSTYLVRKIKKQMKKEKDS